MASTWEGLRAAARSERIRAVVLLSLSSGMPLGLVLIAVPAWLADLGFDIRTIGLVTAAQAPYAFKFAWSPLMDRWHPPVLGRKRGWIVLAQVLLAALTLGLALQASAPVLAAVVALSLALAFVSASQDIAIDAYAVDVLEKDEMALAAGARTAAYLVGMLLAGKIAISLAGRIGWGTAIGIPAALYLVLALVTLIAPEPAAPVAPPPTLRAAVWEPFVGFLQVPRALEIAAFLVLFKLTDNLAGALVSPFLLQQGYSKVDVGIATASIGLAATMVGTISGGIVASRVGLGRALWIAGFLQAVSNIVYVPLATVPPDRALLYAATAVEHAAGGLGTGAFGVLLLQLTQKRFSATQYALFSSLFAIGRTVSGPLAGVLADALGWQTFFLLTIPAAIPGLMLLQRFVPFGTRDIPSLEAAASVHGTPVMRRTLALRGAVAGLVMGAGGMLLSALFAALRTMRGGKEFAPFAELERLLHPVRAVDWLDFVGPALLGICAGIAVAAWGAARHGVRRE